MSGILCTQVIEYNIINRLSSVVCASIKQNCTSFQLLEKIAIYSVSLLTEKHALLTRLANIKQDTVLSLLP